MFNETDYCAGSWVPWVLVAFGLLVGVLYGVFLPNVVRWWHDRGLPGFKLVQADDTSMMWICRVVSLAVAGLFVWFGVGIARSGAC